MQASKQVPISLTCTIDTAAAGLGISRRQVYRLISAKKLRLVKVGRRSLIPTADLHAIAEGRA
ncbi:excisionase family DNA-binding protein [Sphingobium yanoikuyae]|uniref:excisionase family DNA-binding protein n=1 Tax=Sphingobium yanoikuyae TaxID=13690 RepID=UPI000AD85AE4|nr:excisionase family DNA-binding protein [Sphingobium yanoikuyae]